MSTFINFFKIWANEHLVSGLSVVFQHETVLTDGISTINYEACIVSVVCSKRKHVIKRVVYFTGDPNYYSDICFVFCML